MKNFTLFLFLLIGISASSQVKFVNGYFIDISGARTACLIRNTDWNDTPSEFYYKLSEDGPTESKSIYQASEFGFENVKYIGIEIDVDQSSATLATLSLQKSPDFKKQRLFLKVLVDGQAKLYHFSRNDFQRYFYSVNGSPVKQLVFKKYFVAETRHDVAENNFFRQQLYTDVKCSSTTEKDVEKLTYTKKELTTYFESVNACNGEKVIVVEKDVKKGSFNVKASVFVGQHSFSVGSPLGSRDFGSKSYVSFGAEAEYIFPFLNNKWSLLLEPTFSSFDDKYDSEDLTLDLQYKYVRIAFGARHYFFINHDLKIFLNGSLNYDLISNDSRILVGPLGYEPYTFTDNSLTAAIGAGVNFKRLYGEVRLNGKANPTPYDNVKYAYNSLSFILRYRLLDF